MQNSAIFLRRELRRKEFCGIICKNRRKGAHFMNTNISESMLSSFSTAFAAERANQVAQKAVVKSGLSAAAENQKEAIDNPMIFSLELETGDVTDQKSSGRCWLFAGLNTLRFEIMKKLNLKTFELSQN